MSVNHYENFPVASWLCPARIRPAVAAIYRFARTADDIADEGEASAKARLDDLAAYRADLQAVADGTPASARWTAVFGALRPALREFSLPLAPLNDLLSAFEQDVTQSSYADRTELLDYCSRSANPVGRLMLHLYGVTQPSVLQQSDAICTALQLANFWQDLSVDTRRGRHYVPTSECAKHGLPPQAQWTLDDRARSPVVLTELVQWARAMMESGAPLVHRIQGRGGWELRLVVQGGLRILEKIDHLGCAIHDARPQLHMSDLPPMLWRAAWMRGAQRPALAQTS